LSTNQADKTLQDFFQISVWKLSSSSTCKTNFIF